MSIRGLVLCWWFFVCLFVCFAFDTYQTCNEALHYLIRLARSLELNSSRKKVVGLSTHITFLGDDIDTCTCTFSLGQEKLGQLHFKLRPFHNRRRASLKQLQSLAGSLSWAAQVRRGRRLLLLLFFSVESWTPWRSLSKLSIEQDWIQERPFVVAFLFIFINGRVY